MNKLKEGWGKENIDKSKEVLKDHFEWRKQERIYKKMFDEVNRESCSKISPIHSGVDWETDDDIWEDLTEPKDSIEKKSILNRIKAFFSFIYWDFRFMFIKFRIILKNKRLNR